MPDTDGSLAWRAALAACLLLPFASAASAQQPQPPGFAAAPASPDFLTRYDFHMSAAALRIDDPRFTWDTHFGGDLDVFDYVTGRVSILIDYEAVLGSQIRAFDPNQGNYTLEASASARVGRVEIAGALHHVSRHLGDRSKLFPIAWNVVEGRVMGRLPVAGATVDVTVGGGHLVQHSSVDYTWTGNLDLLVRRPVNERLGVFARGTAEMFGIDPAVSNRDRQMGGKAEAGLRISGGSGALELFVGYERRIDADPIESALAVATGTSRAGQALNWALAGFRLVR